MLLINFILLLFINEFSLSSTKFIKRKIIRRKLKTLKTVPNDVNDVYLIKHDNYTLRSGPSISSYILNNKLLDCQNSYLFDENVKGCIPLAFNNPAHVGLPTFDENNKIIKENSERCRFKPIKDCTKFEDNGIIVPCVLGLFYNPEVCMCDWPANVPECINSSRITKPNEPNEPNEPVVVPLDDMNTGSYVNLVCFVTNWSIYRREAGKFVFLRDINPNLCSKIVYAFAGVSGGILQPLDPNIDIVRNGYKDVTSMKGKGKVQEVLISFPGWSSKIHNGIISIFNKNNSAIDKFAKSSVEFINTYNFDGINLDFEMGYDCDKFEYYVKKLREYMNNVNKTISANIFSTKWNMDNNCNSQIVKYLDNIFGMTYQLKNKEYFNSGWDVDDVKNSINYITSYLNFPKDKTYIGIPQWSWSQNALGLKDDIKDLIGKRVQLDDKFYEFTSDTNRIGNIELCMLFENLKKYYTNSMTSYQDNNQNLRRIYSAGMQKQMVEIRNFIINNGYAGGMVWNLDLSDFNNNCRCKNRYQDLYAFTYNNIDESCLLY